MYRPKRVFFVVALIIGIPLVVKAASFGSFGVGGRVSQIPPDLESTITCNAIYGPFTLRPFNTATPGPYFIKNSINTTPNRNKYFLGLYRPVPDIGTCTNPETGVPVPAFEIKVYGVSR